MTLTVIELSGWFGRKFVGHAAVVSGAYWSFHVPPSVIVVRGCYGRVRSPVAMPMDRRSPCWL